MATAPPHKVLVKSLSAEHHRQLQQQSKRTSFIHKDFQIMLSLPETSMAKMSLSWPTRLKATHTTVILWLDGPTVSTLSTPTVPDCSFWNSTIWVTIGSSPVEFSVHLPNTWNDVKWHYKMKCSLQSEKWTRTRRWPRCTGTRRFWEPDIRKTYTTGLWRSPISPWQQASLFKK